MSDQKISELTKITGANLADADEFVVVDVSADQTKAVTRAEFFKDTPPITVTGNLTATGNVYIRDDLFVTGPTPVITLTDNDAADENTKIQNNNGNTFYTSRNGVANGQQIFQQNAGGTITEAMRIDENGRLGLSIQNPTEKLHVVGNAIVSGDVSIGDDLFLNGPNPVITLTDNDIVDEYTKLYSNGGSTVLGSRNGTANGSIIFRGEGGGVADEFARFNASGRLGLGETNPDMKLHIKDASNAYVKLEDSGGVLGGAMSAAVRLYAGDNEHGQLGFAGTGSGLMVLRNKQGPLYLDADSNDAHTNSFMRFAVDNSEAMRIDESGNVGIGKTNPSEKLDVAGKALISGNIVSGEGSGAVALTTNDGHGNANVTFNHANGVPDFLGNGARIIVNTDVRTSPDMIFQLGSAVTAGVPYSTTEYLRVNTNGISVTGTVTATGGIYLGGTAAVNLLDDYEEGTWTPAISDGTNVGTTNVAVGSYTKIGNHVHVQGRVRLSSLGSVSGSIRITGLPFASQALTNNFSAMTIGRATGLNLTAGTNVIGDLRANVTHVILAVWDDASGTTTMQGTEFSANGDISFSMDYISN